MRIRAGPQADTALFFFGRKERGYESDQGKAGKKTRQKA